jgi:hypothetical protein
VEGQGAESGKMLALPVQVGSLCHMSHVHVVGCPESPIMGVICVADRAAVQGGCVKD